MGIKNLKYTRARRIRRRDGVTQRYWCGRRPRKTSLKNLGYAQLKRRGWHGHPYTDTDGDRKVNTFDCRPLNPLRQDLEEDFVVETPNLTREFRNGADAYAWLHKMKATLPQGSELRIIHMKSGRILSTEKTEAFGHNSIGGVHGERSLRIS